MKCNKVCMITGHRIIPEKYRDKIAAQLQAEVLEAIAGGYGHFISGFAEGADLLFADIVIRCKRMHGITLEAALPFPDRIKTPDTTFQSLIRCCDNIHICSDHYFKGCFMKRNRYMVDCSDRILAVYDGRKTGGTAATVRYARDKDVRRIWCS